VSSSGVPNLSDEQCKLCPARMLGDAGQLLGSTVNDLVPPEAQIHLLNAQRELLLAVKATVDHHLKTQQSEQTSRQRRRPVRVELE
jgi:hypothetical protein